MNKEIYTTLQSRELFHLEFLCWLSRRVKPEFYALKGGANLRFFFRSCRYSEDMDMDVHTISVEKLKDIVMEILNAKSFTDNLRTFNIEQIIPPNIAKAKQTQTTQRFKIHLITSSGEDLFTKVEFSRRTGRGTVAVNPVADTILRLYKLAPLVIPHYDIYSAVSQKIDALAGRAVTQARDIFDLFILSSQYDAPKDNPAFLHSGEAGVIPPSSKIKVRRGKQAQNTGRIAKAHENIFAISFEQYRDTVVSYLLAEDQSVYGNHSIWDEIKLKTAQLLEEMKGSEHA